MKPGDTKHTLCNGCKAKYSVTMINGKTELGFDLYYQPRYCLFCGRSPLTTIESALPKPKGLEEAARKGYNTLTDGK